MHKLIFTIFLVLGFSPAGIALAEDVFLLGVSRNSAPVVHRFSAPTLETLIFSVEFEGAQVIGTLSSTFDQKTLDLLLADGAHRIPIGQLESVDDLDPSGALQNRGLRQIIFSSYAAPAVSERNLILRLTRSPVELRIPITKEAPCARVVSTGWQSFTNSAPQMKPGYE